MMEIQGEMSERAIELLELPEDESCMILDLGCGSGLSGTALDEAGHMWVGLDISEAMLRMLLELTTLYSFDLTINKFMSIYFTTT